MAYLGGSVPAVGFGYQQNRRYVNPCHCPGYDRKSLGGVTLGELETDTPILPPETKKTVIAETKNGVEYAVPATETEEDARVLFSGTPGLFENPGVLISLAAIGYFLFWAGRDVRRWKRG